MTRLTKTQRMVRAWLASALVAGAGLFGLAAAPPASAAQDVALGLTTMSPNFATSNSQELTLSGSLTIPSGSSHDDVIVQLAYEPLYDRSSMTEGAGSGNNEIQLNSVQDRLGTLSSGNHAWSLQTSIGSMGLAAGMVYALDVQAYSNGEPLGALRTYLPYKIGTGSSTVAPMQLTVLAPVTTPSTLDGYQESNSGQPGYPELTQDQFAAEMGTNGSLYKLLAAGAQLPKGLVSWAVDPDLLNTAMQIQNGYVVAKSGTAGDALGSASNATDAGTWLKEAKSVLSGTNSELWQLPATDPDIGSLSKASTTEAEQILADAAKQSTSGDTLKSTLGADDSKGLLAWPADGQVSSTTLSLADSIDPTAVVVDSNSIGLAVPNESYTPTGRASASGKNNLVVADTGLDAIMSGDAADASYDSAGSDSTLLAGQRLLAQTALITAVEKPNLGRSIMLTLPRDAGTAANDMNVLKSLQGATWVTPSGLSTLLTKSPDANASTGTPTRSSAAANSDLSTTQLASALSLQSQLKLYQSILTRSDDTSTGFAEAVLRTVSTGWRGQTKAWTTFETTVSSRLTSQTGKVYLIPKSDLTLSGTTGSIPFTVVNNLTQPVQLGLVLQTDPSGLDLTQIPVRQFPTGSTTVEVKVSTKVAVTTYQVTAQLITGNGAHYGTVESGGSQSLQVTVTSIGFVALLLFAGSAGLLVVAVGLRIYRGRKGSRSEPQTREGD